MNFKDFIYKVIVHCNTYNQSTFITSTMDSFCMQQTNFPYICSIIDDASTDGQQEIIKAYLKENFETENFDQEETDYAYLFFAKHKVNNNCYFAVLFLKKNHYSPFGKYNRYSKINYLSQWRNNCKYEAVCEGDDYWISDNKLQKQVDFLENNDDFSLVFHNAFKRIVGSDKDYLFNNIKKDKEIYMKDIVSRWLIPTASILYRLSAVPKYPEWAKEIYSSDQTLALLAKCNGRFYAFSDIMSVYSMDTPFSETSRISSIPEFTLNEHIKLYNYFNEWTDFNYSVIITPHIKYLKNELCYVKNRRKYGQMAIILQPIFMFKKILFKLKICILD